MYKMHVVSAVLNFNHRDLHFSFSFKMPCVALFCITRLWPSCQSCCTILHSFHVECWPMLVRNGSGTRTVLEREHKSSLSSAEKIGCICTNDELNWSTWAIEPMIRYLLGRVLGICVPKRFRFRRVPDQYGLIFNTEQSGSRVTIWWFFIRSFQSVPALSKILPHIFFTH